MNTSALHILLAVLGLAGCAPFEDALHGRMSNKSLDEKRTILADVCGKEISRTLKQNDPTNLRHGERMKQICEKLTGKTVNIYVASDPIVQ